MITVGTALHVTFAQQSISPADSLDLLASRSPESQNRVKYVKVLQPIKNV